MVGRALGRGSHRDRDLLDRRSHWGPYQTNNLFLALVLGLLPLAFPVFKLCLYWLATVYQDNLTHVVPCEMDGPAQQILHGRGPLLGLLILTVKTLPEDQATIEWGPICS